MTSKRTEKKLADLGFEFDEDVTFKNYTGFWHGTIDPIGRKQVAGDNVCCGRAVCGTTRAEMDRDALEYAAWAFPTLIDCEDPECEMHGDQSA